MTTLPAVLATKSGAAIREHRYANGLTLLIAERHLDPVVSVILWYRVGSRDEDERVAGVSHFLEHMMFKGSARFAKGEVDRVTTLLGGTNNAFTSADHTGYWFELASDRWEAALEIESDRMRGLLLDPTEFAAEKSVVLEELAMGRDEPWRRLTELVQSALFDRHPYRRPVIGHVDSLTRLAVDEMRAHHARYYRPDNAVLVVSGDVDPARVVQRVDELFGSITAPPLEAQTPFQPVFEEPSGERRIETSWDDAGKRLCIAWPGAKVGSDDDWALDVISTVLTGGRLARLHRRLVLDEALATTVSTQNDARVESGAFWLFAECAQGADPAALERAIDEELAKISKQIVPAREIDRARRMISASEAAESETVSDLAEDLGEFAADAHWRLSLEAVDKVRAVTPAAMRECASRLLTRERRIVAWSLPKAKAKSKQKPKPKPKRGARSKPQPKPKPRRGARAEPRPPR